jgi:galactokinase
VSVRWRAPGRVNLIGEHTDYNAGFALPFAIEQACVAEVDFAEPGQLLVRSAQRDDPVLLPIDDLEPGTAGWAGYVAGVIAALRTRGVAVPGLRIDVDSTVPGGGGLSSSAALTCSVASAVDDLLGLGLGPDELLAVTRSAENDFVGAPTGGMDQLAALRATAGHALLCDMRAVTGEQLPFDLAADGLTMLVIDTRAPHRHADGEYRVRRAGCERAAGLLGVTALRDIGVDDLAGALARLPDDELRRYTRHIVTENQRVLDTAVRLRAGHVREIGSLLVESHRSMREDYRITVPELDIAVGIALDHGAWGARMTGGGFGGSIIALLDAGRADEVADAVSLEFSRRRFAPPAWFTARPSAGARRC